MKNFKCLLVHTPRLHNNDGVITSDVNYCAMGLFSLAGELNKNGFSSKIINLGIEKYLNKNFLLSSYVKENDIKLLAFSLHWNHNFFDVIKTAKYVKEKCPDVFITLGGYTASFYAQEIMNEFSFVDAIIRGEGEYSIVEIAKALFKNTSFDNIPNLFYRKNLEIILNKNLFVATSDDLNKFEFFNPQNMVHYDEYTKIPYVLKYNLDNQLVSASTTQGVCLGRGCFGNCIWCGGGHYAERKISGRDFISYRKIESVVSELKEMKNKYNIENFRFSFDPNPKDRNYLIELFDALYDEFKGNLSVLYNLDGLPDDKFLSAYKKAVSKNSILYMSPVSYNEIIRRKYKSFYYSNDELESVLSKMDNLEISSEIYFYDIPELDDNENLKSQEYALFLKNKYKFVKDAYMYSLEIVPASILFENPEKYKLKNVPASFWDYYNRNDAVVKSFEY
ncbi:cobalamin-dependent protein [bacterium]|nr:cobalamin-dependent protein [bacterium]